MASNAPRRTYSGLMGYLGAGPVKRMVETSFFKGPSIRFGQALAVSVFLYETGAILGRAKRDKLRMLAKIAPVSEGREEDFINFLQENARARLEKFGKEPDSFFNLIISTELDRVGLSLTGSTTKVLMKAFGEKYPMQTAEPLIKLIGEEGIGFGSCFPALTEKIWKHAYESADMDKWAEARAYGVTLPERPPKMSFNEREQTVLEMVAIYVSECFP